MSEQGEQRTARLELQEARLRLAYAAVCLAVLAWYLIPDHNRRQAAARIRRVLAPAVLSVLSAAHQAEVRRAMAREAETGVEDYAAANRIAAWRARWAR